MKALKALTAREIEALKPTAEAYYVSINDPKIPGLAMRVSPAGRKTWTLRYRIGRLQRRLTLGTFPAVSLADARKLALEHLGSVSAGNDPAQEKEERRDADTVGDFVPVYINEYAKRKKKTWKVDQSQLTLEVLPKWKHRLVRDITARDVRELIDGIANRPAPVVSNRVRSLLSKFFNFAIERDIIALNPVTKTERREEFTRERALTRDEIRTFWKSCEALSPEMCAMWRLRLITAQRRGEVTNMRWQDVDLQDAMWTLPGRSVKNKTMHRVPLSAPALDILKTLRAKADERMAAQKEPKPPVYVLENARGKRQQAEAAATFGIPDFKGHDLRRTAVTMLASQGVDVVVLARILNHTISVGPKVTAVYMRYAYDNEKRVALDQWARMLTGIIENKEGANVLAFATA